MLQSDTVAHIIKVAYLISGIHYIVNGHVHLVAYLLVVLHITTGQHEIGCNIRVILVVIMNITNGYIYLLLCQ
jgi:hypothetical protein